MTNTEWKKSPPKHRGARTNLEVLDKLKWHDAQAKRFDRAVKNHPTATHWTRSIPGLPSAWQDSTQGGTDLWDDYYIHHADGSFDYIQALPFVEEWETERPDPHT